MNTNDAPSASIVLCCLGNPTLATYGYRSWLLQDIDRPYEVILSLFNDQQAVFESLHAGATTACLPVIRSYKRPAFFNISAANNLGLHVARGRYVFFANADIIYPSHYLKLVLAELEQRSIDYATGSRINLPQALTNSFKPAGEYGKGDFDFLTQYDYTRGMDRLRNVSPWILSRETAFAIGGFDPAILCNEDSDLDLRAMHYLKRAGKQSAAYSLSSPYGYHLWHPQSEIFLASPQAMEAVQKRYRTLSEQPDSPVFKSPSRLDNLESLLDDFYKTERPKDEITPQRALHGAGYRLRTAFNILTKGRAN